MSEKEEQKKDYKKFGKTVLTSYINGECERKLFLDLSRDFNDLWMNPVRDIKKPKFVRSDKSALLGKNYEQNVYTTLKNEFFCINLPKKDGKVSVATLTANFLNKLYGEMHKTKKKRVFLLEYQFTIPEKFFLDIFSHKKDGMKIPLNYSTQRPDIMIIENESSNINTDTNSTDADNTDNDNTSNNKKNIQELLPDGKVRDIPQNELDIRHGISIIDIKDIKDEKIGKKQFIEIFYYLRTLSYFIQEKGLDEKYYVKIDFNGIFPSREDTELKNMVNFDEFMDLVILISWKESIRIYNKAFKSISKLWEQAPCSIKSVSVNIQPTCGYCNYIEDCKNSLGMEHLDHPENWSVRLLPYTEQSVAEKLIESGYETIGDVAKNIKNYKVGITPEAIYSELPLLELKAQAIVKQRALFPEQGKTHIYTLPRYTPISLIFAVETDPMSERIFAVALYFNMSVHPKMKYSAVFDNWWKEWQRALQQELSPKQIKKIFDPILFKEISIEDIETFLECLKILDKFKILLPGETFGKNIVKQTRIFYQFPYISNGLDQDNEIKLGKKVVKRLHKIIEISNIMEKYVGIEEEWKEKKYWSSPIMGIYYWGNEQYENFQQMLQRNIREFIDDPKINKEFTEVISWIAPSDSEVKHPYQHKKIFDLQKFIQTILGFPCVINYSWHEIAEKQLGMKSNKKYWAKHFNYMDFSNWHEYLIEINNKAEAEKNKDSTVESIEDIQSNIDKKKIEIKKQILHKTRQINNILTNFQRNARTSISKHARPMKTKEFQKIPLDSNFHSIAQVWYLYSKLNGTTSEMDVELFRTNFPEFGIAKLRVAEVKDFDRNCIMPEKEGKLRYYFDIVGLSTNVKMGEGDRVLLIPDEMRDMRMGGWTRIWTITIQNMFWDQSIKGYHILTEETKHNLIDLYYSSVKNPRDKTKWYLYPISMDVWSTKLHNRNGLLERENFGGDWLGKRLSFLWNIRAKPILKWPKNWTFNSPNIYLYAPEIILDLQSINKPIEKIKLETKVFPPPDKSQEPAIINALNNVMYAIKGPPGTGKSQTIAALIDEYLERRKKQKKVINRILITAFSYSAIRVLIDKLRKITDESGNPTIAAETQMVFLRSSYQKEVEDLPKLKHVDDLVRDGSAWRWNGQKRVITKTKTLEEKLENSVIIFTNAHQLYHMIERVYPSFAFDLIVVDEASQVPVDQVMAFFQFIKHVKFNLKPKNCKPIADKLVKSSDLVKNLNITNDIDIEKLTKFIIVGDYNQLPPVQQVKPPKNLNKILDSLFSYYVAEHNIPNDQLATNYRSHRDIVNFTSTLGIYSKLSAFKNNANEVLEGNIKNIKTEMG